MRREQKATRDAVSKDNNDYTYIKPFGNIPFEEYTVKKGDTLSKIALEYYVDVFDLAGMNEMKSSQLNHIKVGQKLKVPPSVLFVYRLS